MVITPKEKFPSSFVKNVIYQAENVGKFFIEMLKFPSASYSLFPTYTNKGTWNYGKHWSNGFLSGYFANLYELTNDPKWMLHSNQTSKMLLPLLQDESRFQDIGFIFYFSNIGRNPNSESIIRAADYLLNCMEEDGYLYVNWKQGSNYIAVDQLANMSLFILAYELTNDNRYYTACEKIIKSSLIYLIKQDGFTYEYFNIITYCSANTNAPDESSIWARGHMWAVYGLSLAYSKLNIDCYKVLEKLCSIALESYKKMPFCWCFGEENSFNLQDTSAAAICLSAISYKDILAGSAVINELHTLLIKHFMSLDVVNASKKKCSVLNNVSTPLKIINTNGESAIWGEYFFLEAVMKNYKN